MKNRDSLFLSQVYLIMPSRDFQLTLALAPSNWYSDVKTTWKVFQGEMLWNTVLKTWFPSRELRAGEVFGIVSNIKWSQCGKYFELAFEDRKSIYIDFLSGRTQEEGARQSIIDRGVNPIKWDEFIADYPSIKNSVN